VRLLADIGVSLTTVEALRSRGHDVKHLREEGLHKLPDAQILEKARRESRTVIAFDLDFGDLLAAGGQTGPSVVILRLSNQTPSSVNPRLIAALAQCEAELAGGAVVIEEETRYRLRRLPIKPPVDAPPPHAGAGEEGAVDLASGEVADPAGACAGSRGRACSRLLAATSGPRPRVAGDGHQGVTEPSRELLELPQPGGIPPHLGLEAVDEPAAHRLPSAPT
jgi:predicted nuclease of predicted toxin-antitoxin system